MITFSGNKKTITINKPQSPIDRVKFQLKKEGFTLRQPYQEDGVKWMIKREKPITKETKECDICNQDVSVNMFSKISCCKGNICDSCSGIWSRNHTTCPFCRQDFNPDVDTKLYGGLLCDEMGLGKTIQMISMMMANPVNSTLIILPSCLIDQWCTEITKFAPTMNIMLYYGESRPSLDTIQNEKNIVLLTSYGMLLPRKGRECLLNQHNWDRLILDECHYIRNPASKVFKAVAKFSATNRWGITGTPIQNYRKDFITLLGFLGIKRAKFSDNNLKMYAQLYMIRRTKKQVEEFDSKLALPNCIIKKIELDFKTKEEKEFYNKVSGDVVKALSNYKFDQVHAFEELLRLRQVSILPQLVLDGYSKKWNRDFPEWKHSNTKLEYIIDNVRNTDRTIIFSQFKGEMAYLKDRLEENELNVECIDGGISMRKRSELIERTKKEDDVDVLIIQINAGGTGLNLENFNTVYFTSPSWNPSLKDQAIARAHRIGQKNQVNVYMPLIKDTIDYRIYDLQKEKKILFNEIIDLI